MSKQNPFSSPWVYSVYFLQGFPYAVVTMVTEILYQQLGLTNARITFLTAILGLPWMLKCFWGPLFEHKGAKHQWIIAMQGCMTLITLILLVLVGSSVPSIWLIFVALMLLAFSSAVHDFNADGYYILKLPKHEQAYLVGWRSGAYQAGRFCAQGGLLILLGWLEQSLPQHTAWQLTYAAAFAVFLGLFIIDWLIVKPEPIQRAHSTNSAPQYCQIMRNCLSQHGVIIAYSFVFFIVLGQVQLNKILPLFMLDKAPGMGLSALDVGEMYGAIGTISIILGAIMGGMIIARYSLRRCALPSLLLLAITNLFFILFSAHWISSHFLFSVIMIIDQFTFGLALATQMTYMLQFVANSRFVSSGYALLGAIMVLAMIVGGATSGEIEAWLGYSGFFIWTAALSLPGILLLRKALDVIPHNKEADHP